MKVTIFRVLFDEGRTRIDTNEDLMGVGIAFPSGHCYVDWNRDAYDEDDRLEHPHVSIYGSFADVEQGTGGTVETITEIDAEKS